MSAATMPPFELFGPNDGEAYRRLARLQTAGVAIITLRRREESVGVFTPLLDGFTATTFITVSMAPPIVLVSASNAGNAFTMLRDAAAFAVNLLAVEQRPLADLFATPHDRRGDPFAVHSWTPDAHGVPLLPGALGAYSATVRELVSAGDHTLCLGDVTAIQIGGASDALAYHNRRYGGFAPVA